MEEVENERYKLYMFVWSDVKSGCYLSSKWLQRFSESDRVMGSLYVGKRGHSRESIFLGMTLGAILG